MEYLNNLQVWNMWNMSGFFFVMSYSILHIYFIAEYFLSYDIKTEYIELEKSYILKSKEIQRLKLINDKLKLELKNNKQLLLKNKEDNGDKEDKEDNKNYRKSGKGPLRYKIEGEKDIYFHGIGHLENRFSWWDPLYKHSIIEYKDNSKIKYPNWETNDINDFCTNCTKSEKLNKKRRVKIFYTCNGHIIE